MELYTVAKMVKILNITESTARYYRDIHSEFLPFTGSGRKRRYKKEALEALRLIAEMANRSLSAEEIDTQLSKELSRNIETEEQTAVTTTAEQQQSIVKALSDNLGAIADQKKEIQDLREEVRELRDIVRLSWWQKLVQRKKEK